MMSKYLLERQAKMFAGQGNSKKDQKQERTRTKKEAADWYGVQTLQAPACCENCGRSLESTINFHPRAHICHIVKKTKSGGVPSVATHPRNRWFGCKSCHDGYDIMMDEKEFTDVVQMKVWPKIVERFQEVLPHIKESEMKNVPQVLLDAAKKATKPKAKK